MRQLETEFAVNTKWISKLRMRVFHKDCIMENTCRWPNSKLWIEEAARMMIRHELYKKSKHLTCFFFGSLIIRRELRWLWLVKQSRSLPNQQRFKRYMPEQNIQIWAYTLFPKAKAICDLSILLILCLFKISRLSSVLGIMQRK